MALPSPEELDAMMAAESKSGGLPSPEEIDLMMQSEMSPDTTGSFGGDTLDFLGGLGKRAFEGLGTTIAAPIDLAATALASGIESAATGDLQWLEGQGLGDYFSGGLEDITGNIGEQSAAGRIGSNIGDLTGTAAGFILPAGAVSKGAGLLGKAGRFLSANPVRQLGLSAAGGLAGQSAVEAGLVEEDGLGKLGIELGTMTAPDLLQAGLSGAKGLGRYFYQGGDEAANEVLKTVSGTLDDASVLTRPATSASGQVSREEFLGDLVKTARNVAGQQKEEALNTVAGISSEAAQLTDELSALKRLRFGGKLDAAGAERIKQIEGILDSVPATRVVDEGFPLLNEKYGDFVSGTAKVEAVNPLKGAIDQLADKKAEFSEMAKDLYKVFRTGKFAGRGVSLEDYQQAASKVGRSLSNPQNAKTFKEVMGSNPEAISLGKASMLQELFSGTPTSWLNKVNKNRGALQELFEPSQVQAIEKIASKNKGVVGGAIIANAARFLDNRIVRYGLLGSSAAFGGIGSILGTVALNKAASAIARKPDVMQQAISAAFQNPEVAELMIKRATPRNLKLAKEYFLNAGKSAIMGKAADALDGDEDENIQMGDEIISEKKTEQIRITPDVDLTPQTTELSPKLIKKVIAQESAFNPKAVSPKGAAGLMQLMPATGKEWHDKLGLEGEYDPFNEEQNKAIGTAYLGWLHDQFGGDTKLALAAYNWGIGNMKKLLKRTGATSFDEIKSQVPDETKNYVRKITTGLEEI